MPIYLKNPTIIFFSIIILCLIIFFGEFSRHDEILSASEKKIAIEKPEVKSILTFFDTQYKQILPINGQVIGDKVILFEWMSALDVKTNLVIKNAETGCNVYVHPINTEKGLLKLNKYLGRGKYTWSLAGFSGEKVFVMK